MAEIKIKNTGSFNIWVEDGNGGVKLIPGAVVAVSGDVDVSSPVIEERPKRKKKKKP